MRFSSYRQVWFPYCLHRCSNGTWLLLNRHYKPLGVDRDSAWVDYDTCPGVRVRLTAPQRTKFLANPRADTLHLYDDGTNPDLSAANARVYFEKVAVLVRAKVVAA